MQRFVDPDGRVEYGLREVELTAPESIYDDGIEYRQFSLGPADISFIEHNRLSREEMGTDIFTAFLLDGFE